MISLGSLLPASSICSRNLILRRNLTLTAAQGRPREFSQSFRSRLTNKDTPQFFWLDSYTRSPEDRSGAGGWAFFCNGVEKARQAKEL